MTDVNIDNILIELARTELDYCRTNQLEEWITLEQAAHIITQDGRIEVLRTDELHLYATIFVHTFNELIEAYSQREAAETAAERRLNEQVRHLVAQHLGDDWTIEGHEALTVAFLEIVKQQQSFKA